MIGAKSRATVHRYITKSAASKRYPDPDMIAKIAEVTKGVVTANDFYQVKASNGKANGHE